MSGLGGFFVGAGIFWAGFFIASSIDAAAKNIASVFSKLDIKLNWGTVNVNVTHDKRYELPPITGAGSSEREDK